MGGNSEHDDGAPPVVHFCAHDPVLDPRVGWVVQTFRQAGWRQRVFALENPERPDSPSLRWVVPVCLGRREDLPLAEALVLPLELGWAAVTSPRLSVPFRLSLGTFGLLASPVFVLLFVAGLTFARVRPKWTRILNAALKTPALLFRSALDDDGPSPVVIYAHDLGALLPSVLFASRRRGAELFYDAHEYWPEVSLEASSWENWLRSRYESFLLRFVDRAFTVNERLAKLQTDTRGIVFEAVPNCVPLSEGELRKSRDARPETSPLKVLFQGKFGSNRGVEIAIEAWRNVGSSAHLLLRGPSSEYRDACVELAKKYGLLDRTVFFPPAVSEAELVEEAAQADVGLVSYRPVNVNHRLCCPNKVSQYMAAGLAIVANRLDFVADTLESGACGLIYEDTPESLSAVIRRLVDDRTLLLRLQTNARKHFESAFHWEAQALPLRKQIERAGRPGNLFTATVPATA